MKQFITMLAVGLLAFITVGAYAQTGLVRPFHEAVISPYIQVTFVQGDEERVIINQMAVDSSKLHVEVRSGTLRMYLDGAKNFPHNKTYNNDGDRFSKELYPNHAVVATVVYKKLTALSLRGEETYVCQSPLRADHFSLHVYGESTVNFTEVHFEKMHSSIYGESTLNIQAGEVNRQYYTCFGEGRINTTAITGRAAWVTTFGEAEFRVNVSDRIKIAAFGDARLRYMGNPDIVKGIHFGDMDLQRLD